MEKPSDHYSNRSWQDGVLFDLERETAAMNVGSSTDLPLPSVLSYSEVRTRTDMRNAECIIVSAAEMILRDGPDGYQSRNKNRPVYAQSLAPHADFQLRNGVSHL